MLLPPAVPQPHLMRVIDTAESPVVRALTPVLSINRNCVAPITLLSKAPARLVVRERIGLFSTKLRSDNEQPHPCGKGLAEVGLIEV